MKKGWEMKRLGEVMSIQRGGSPRPIKNYLTKSPSGLNWIKISDATNSGKYIFQTAQKIKKEGLNKTRFVQEGDFLLSNSMSFGRPYIMGTTGCIHDGWLVLREKGGKMLNKDFLYYLLGSPYIFKQFDRLAAGSTVRNLNTKLVSSVQIPLPPLSEQQAIVARLDAAFAQIDQAQANLERNIEHAKELFQSKLNAIFSQRGAGWEERKLESLIDVKHGFAFKSKFFASEGKYVLLTPGNYYESGGYKDRGHKQKYYNGDIPEDFILGKGDLLVAMTEQAPGLLGSPLIVPEENKFLHNQRLGLIRIKDGINLQNNFLFYLFNTKHFRKEIYKSGTGVKVRHTSPKKICDVNVAVSFDYRIQVEIIENLSCLTTKVNKIIDLFSEKQTQLEELKKSLLQKAFAGELV